MGRTGGGRWQRAALAAFFLGLLGIGWAVHGDYGVPWDEPRQRQIGGVSLRYVLQTLVPNRPLPPTLPDNPLATFDDRDYGVAFEGSAAALELALGLTDTRDVYRMRHFAVYLAFLAGVFAVYRLAARRFGDWRVGLLAATMLVLSPRMFAEGFYNSKDIVYMASFAVATNTMMAFVLRPGAWTAVAHAVATALAIDVRVAALVLVPITLGLLAVESGRQRRRPASQAVLVALFLVVATGGVVLAFPLLWEEPLGRFADVVRNMSSFQRFSDRVRYMGGDLMPDDLPWHYLPVWLGITTPLVYVGLGMLGIGITAATTIRRHVRFWADEGHMQDLVFLVLACAPLLVVMLTGAVVYDGWRHVYFVYPPFVLLAIRGLSVVWAQTRHPMVRASLVASLALSFANTLVWMVTAHPMQNVYFNALAGAEWRRSYEVDYWGLGNRIAVEYVLRQDPDQVLTFRAESSTPLGNVLLMLPPADRARVRVVDAGQPARYVLTNYRGVDVDDVDGRPRRRLFYQLRVAGQIVLSVYETVEG